MKTTATSRLLFAVVGSTTLASCIFAYTGIRMLPKQESDQSGFLLCTEVRHELRLSVRSGLISQKDADAVSRRCFQRYGGDK